MLIFASVQLSLQPLRMAEADVIRAKRRIDEEKYRGLSLGKLCSLCSR